MKNKVIIGAIIVLAGALIFENAYLLGRYSQENVPRVTHKRYQQPVSLEREQGVPEAVLDTGDPFREVNRMQERMNHIFSDNFSAMPNLPDVSNNKVFVNSGISFNNAVDAYVVKVSIPGVKKEDIDIQVKGRQLIITAGSSKDKTDKNKNLYSREYSSGNFLSNFMLPEDAQINNIISDYKNGVLTINIPKKEAEKIKKLSTIKVPVK